MNIYPQSYFCILLYGSSPGEGLEVRGENGDELNGRLLETRTNTILL